MSNATLALEFKSKVALEALKCAATVAELASGSGVHPTMIHQWKRARLEGASGLFERGGLKNARDCGGSTSSSWEPRSAVSGK